MKKYKHIIWDWNGTIVNDVSLSVSILNSLLELRSLPQITLQSYKETFSFPVPKFYEALGFSPSKEEFDELGKLFISQYNAKRFDCPLNDGVWQIINGLTLFNVKQSILSAYHKDYLQEAAEKFKVARFMSHIEGLDNINAESKIELGKKLIEKIALPTDQVLLVGDTDHDYAVAKEIGTDCMLVAKGHQSKVRLNQTGAKVFNDFYEIIDYFTKG